jgi:phosphopantothenoylcysteine decarboxylase/phosphopantothenate--cysteine ligase
MAKNLKNKKIIVGVSGGVAIYKICALIRLFLKNEAQVRVVMSENATKLISPVMFQTLTHFPVYTSMFEPVSPNALDHINVAEWGDIFILAPATANTIAKVVNGIADNLLTSVILALPEKTPLVVVPAMNDNMWKNIFTQENVKKLEKRKDCHVIEPVKGVLASGKVGEGKMVEVEKIFEVAKKVLF